MKHIWYFNAFWRTGIQRRVILGFDASGTGWVQTGQALHFKHFGEKKEGTVWQEHTVHGQLQTKIGEERRDEGRYHVS